MFRHVYVDLDLGSVPDRLTKENAEQLVKAANHELYSLCSFFTTSTALKTVTVEVRRAMPGLRLSQH